MTDCATCGGPMVWSDDKMRQWCAVFGDHPELRRHDVCDCASCEMQRARWARRNARLRAVS